MKKTVLIGLGLSLLFSTNAQVMFTDLNPDDTINAVAPPGETFLLDFNNDAIFELAITAADTTVDIGFPVPVTGVSIIPLADSVKVLGRSTTVGIETVYLSDGLPSGQMIDGTGSYIDADSLSNSTFPGLILGADVASGTYVLGDFPNDNWLYFGVEFEISGSKHYGWVRVNVSTTANRCITDSYAYEATAGDGIEAGDMGTGFVSIEDIEGSSDLYFAQNNLYVVADGNASFQIFNMIGATVWSGSTNGNKTIDLSHLPKGAYIVKHDLGHGANAMKFIIE